MAAEGGAAAAAAAAAVGGDGDGDVVGASLIRELASCNKPTRDRALNALLKTWLPSQHQLSDDDMKKLWKGLFYCVWHSDKVPVQSHLVHRLSSLLLALPLPLSLHYLSVFLLTMRREWPGIDALRLDKFYLLIRRFLHSSFLMLKKNYTWDPETSRRLMGVIEEKSFFADDNFLGNGVNYHTASIFIEELKPFLPLSSEIVDVMLKPFLLVMCKSQDKVLLGKVKSNMFDVLLKMGRSLLEIKKLGDDAAADSGDEDCVEVLGTIALTMDFSAKFFDLGSSPDCLQGNRKVLFSLHKDFLRLEKDLALAGIEISTPDFVVEDKDEVPKLIPMVPDPSEVALEAANASAHEPLKKKKRKNASDRSNDKAKALDGANKNETKTKKKEKKKKKHGLPEQGPAVADKGDIVVANGEGSSNGMRTTSDKTNLIFSESVISNLQKQFENVAEGVDLDKDDSSSYDSPENTIRDTISKKRKRLRSKDGQDTHNVEDTGCDAAASAAAVSLEKSAKKVRFSIKNNLVWKPHSSPLPPQSLRLPPSVTPRGSALKKGTPPGPIREMTQVTKKKMKQKKKGRKGIKMVAPAVKRLRKLKTISI